MLMRLNFPVLAGSLLLLTSWAINAQVPETMQAIQVQQFGGPEVLTLRRIATPQPAADGLLVRVKASGVNPVDTGARSGHSAALTNAVLPHVPGFDVSGYAEYAVVKGSEAALKPGNLSFTEAAALPLVALTAWQALFDTADLQTGQTVLSCSRSETSWPRATFDLWSVIAPLAAAPEAHRQIETRSTRGKIVLESN